MADGPDVDALAAELADFDVGQFLLAACSTLASMAFAKLDQGDAAEARKSIDALAALLPLLDGGPRRDFAPALASLQVAYAAAVASST